jgi:Uncharacterized protein conserved in bacteria (DUF2252)
MFPDGMNIIEATKSYEAWLAAQTRLLPGDLALKHEWMREDLFSFLRATYYRWAQVWPAVCPECVGDVKVLAVGDLHVENFGTWRDSDGRLVWGINDFDECYSLPFTHDLVRLAVSVRLAIGAGELALAPRAAAAAIMEGYRACLAAGGRPFILADESTPLRDMARDRLNTPERFWKKLHSYSPTRGTVPSGVVRAIRGMLPDSSIPLKFLHRVAGLGGLGKQRYTAVGMWRGGQIAREAKVLSASACRWAEGGNGRGEINYARILRLAVRCPDPFAVVRGRWLLRRLSPDCFKILLSSLPKTRNETELLFSMGWESANIHLGSVKPAKLAAALKRKTRGWLHHAGKAMRDQTISDWKAWRR